MDGGGDEPCESRRFWNESRRSAEDVSCWKVSDAAVGATGLVDDADAVVVAAVPVAALALATPMLDEDGVEDDDVDVKGGKVVVGSLCGKGRRRYGGREAVAASPAPAPERSEDEGGGKMWSKRVRSDAAGDPTPIPTAAPKGGDGMPVNSCTMARKLEVSVVSTVVGARRDARVRFREPLGGGCCAGAAAGAPIPAASCPCVVAATAASTPCGRAAAASVCATRGEDTPDVPANDPDAPDHTPACCCCCCWWWW
nr:unnamed protein product [Digitaria exilis]